MERILKLNIPLVKTLYKKIIPLQKREAIWREARNFKLRKDLFLVKWMCFSPIMRLFKRIFRPRTILFYPHTPSRIDYKMYKICYLLGYKIINNPKKHFDQVFIWDSSTRKKSDETLVHLTEKFECINKDCKDISKKTVQSVFEEVFGYPLAIDPLTFLGQCVVKSDLNGKHDGQIIKCPVNEIKENVVYQRLVNTQFDDEFVEDIRVPIFGERIPLVFKKYRSINDRFDNYKKTVIADPCDLFSEEEMKKIIYFCRRMGLDCGELDVLRDRDNGQLYIVDVNNTPWSVKPKKGEEKAYWASHKVMTNTFEEVFMQNERSVNFS